MPPGQNPDFLIQFFFYNDDLLEYLDDFNSTDERLQPSQDPEWWSPRGVNCVYQNATYEATTSFSNNTQLSKTHVKELHDPIQRDGSSQAFASINMTSAFLSIAQSLNVLLNGDMSVTGAGSFGSMNTQVLYTPLFRLISLSTPTSGPFGSTQYSVFSLLPSLGGNLASGIQDLLGNITLAFVNMNMATTQANATVNPGTTEYQYVGRSLGLIYGAVFASSLIVVGYGLFCLRANGATAVFDLKHIVEMTAGSEGLYESVTYPEFRSRLVRGVFSYDSRDGVLEKITLDIGRIPSE